MAVSYFLRLHEHCVIKHCSTHKNKLKYGILSNFNLFVKAYINSIFTSLTKSNIKGYLKNVALILFIMLVLLINKYKITNYLFYMIYLHYVLYVLRQGEEQHNYFNNSFSFKGVTKP